MSYIGNQPTSVAFLTDQFSGTGSQVAFTLSAAPANPASILVAVSGVLQDPSTYGVSGTTLTFTGAPPSGTGNISVRYLGVPASNITTAAYRTVTEITATAGQTVFTPASYNAGYINVYRNGVLLGSADYTATNGTTVTLGTACIAGELVAVESFYISTVIGAIPATAGAVTSTYIQTSPTLTTPTITSPTISGTYTAGTSLITSGTSVPTTSGTSVPISTTIPSWVKRITVMLNGVSTSGTANLLIQLGTSGGLVSSGYVSGTSTGSTPTSTAGFLVTGAITAAQTTSGVLSINLFGSNTWVASGNTARDGTVNPICACAGYGAIGGTVTQLAITTTGSDTFDAGSVNILYE
jgi:hypothetical protein